jgi:CBS domain-containing protein
MNAGDLMTSHPRVLTADETVTRAATLMRDLGIGCLPVVDDLERLRPIGLITDRDIVVRCVAQGHVQGCRVGEHMTPGTLDTVTKEADVAEVMSLMERDQVRRILVTDEGRLVGIIAQADLALKDGPLDPVRVEQVLERVSAPAVPLAR